MKKRRWGLAALVVVGVWAAFTAYFAYLHTFTILTCYLDKKVTLDDRQYIIQEIDVFNFEKVFPDNFNYWPLDVLEKLPVSLRRPFWEVANLYSRPSITYKDTWEVNIKGVAIPRLPEPPNGNIDIYIDGHMRGLGFQQDDNSKYTLFNSRGDNYSSAEVNQPITLVFEDENTGHKAEIKLQPQWKKKCYFMGLPGKMSADPAATARKFFALASQGQKSEALKLVTAEKRNEITWPPSTAIWNQMSLEDNLSYSLERQVNQGKYPIIYSLTIEETVETKSLTVNMIKKQNCYEIIDIK